MVLAKDIKKKKYELRQPIEAFPYMEKYDSGEKKYFFRIDTPNGESIHLSKEVFDLMFIEIKAYTPLSEDVL
jgi:hypothetical protein